MKKAFWSGFYLLLRVQHLLLGSIWRRLFSPRADFFLAAGRMLRMFLWAHRLESFGKRCGIGRGVRIYAPLRVRMGNESAIFERAYLSGPGTFVLGDRSSIGAYTSVACRERIEIGSDTLIAGNCFILDVDHDFDDRDTPIPQQGVNVRPVRIGNDVWVGTHCVILRGVTIGDGAVIAANSVVTRDIPPYSIAAGTPARVIRARGERSSAVKMSPPIATADGSLNP